MTVVEEPITERERAWQLNLPAVVHFLTPTVYFVTEAYCASKFTPPYSYAGNFISDLGIEYPRPDPAHGGRIAQSHAAAIMNGNFIITGVGFFIAALLLSYQFWHQGPQSKHDYRLWIVRTVLGTSYAIGSIMVASVAGGPRERKDGTIVVHELGAVLSIGCGNVNSIVDGIMVLRESPATLGKMFAWSSVFLGVFATILGLLVQPLGTPQTIGWYERAAVYPFWIWMYLKGIELAVVSKRTKTKAS